MINSKTEKGFVPAYICKEGSWIRQNNDLHLKRRTESFHIHRKRIQIRSFHINSAIINLIHLIVISYWSLSLLAFDNELTSFHNSFATAFHPRPISTRSDTLFINNRLYKNFKGNHFAPFILLSSGSDEYNSNDNDNKQKNKKKQLKRKKMIIDIDKDDDAFDNNLIFVENASKKVKDVTSSFIAPLAIDEDILGDYCSTNSDNEDCILLNYNSNSMDLSRDEVDLNGIEMDFDTRNEGDVVDIDMGYDGMNTNNFQDMYNKNQMKTSDNTNGNSDQKSVVKERKKMSETIDNYIKFIPFVAPLLAFHTYDMVSAMYNFFIEFLSKNTWQSVDGRAFEIQTITPAINGIVVPSVSILFATLSGTTISTLRQRQLDIRTCLNMEGSEIRFLQSMVDSFPSYSNNPTTENSSTHSESSTATSPLYQPIQWRNSANIQTNSLYDNKEVNMTNKSSSKSRSMQSSLDFQDKCRAYLIKYTGRIIRESQPGVVYSNLEFKGSLDSEMNGFLVQLNEMATTTASSSISSQAPHPTILAEAYGAISRLNSYRSTRISALQSTFPTLHFVIVFTLGASICFTFLMETNQEILYFLNEIQLKMLWTILIGTNSSLGVVCYDLLDPFRGSYQITSSIDQLYTIREVLRASDRLKKFKRIEKEYYDNRSKKT